MKKKVNHEKISGKPQKKSNKQKYQKTYHKINSYKMKYTKLSKTKEKTPQTKYGRTKIFNKFHPLK
jgi:hypothetical protein